LLKLNKLNQNDHGASMVKWTTFNSYEGSTCRVWKCILNLSFIKKFLQNIKGMLKKNSSKEVWEKYIQKICVYFWIL
jgi:hypothetical protein